MAALGEDDIMLSMTVSRSFLRRSLESSLSRESAGLAVCSTRSTARRTIGAMSVFMRRERRIRRYMQEMLCELYDPSPNGSETSCVCFSCFWPSSWIATSASWCAARRTAAAGPTALVTGMLGYIDREFAACSLEGMAAEFGLSPNYATALLKRHVGKTFRQLVQERRLVRAAELLRGGATAGAAAHAVGYENMSFFYRKFHDKYGCTPAAYRR